MDQRCPNCQKPYELDAETLQAGGAAIRCAFCDNLFRVHADGSHGPSIAPARMDDEERSWLIRLPDGEIRVCRELKTLQRWIVSGDVSPDCEISRTGKQWKPLSGLAELGSLFVIAAEARNAAKEELAQNQVPPARKVEINNEVENFARENDFDTVEISPEESQRILDAAQRTYDAYDQSTPPVEPETAVLSLAKPSSDRLETHEPQETLLAASPPPPSGDAAPKATDDDETNTGRWAADDKFQPPKQRPQSDGDSGPTHGFVLPDKEIANDAAFAASKVPATTHEDLAKGRFDDLNAGSYDEDDDFFDRPKRSAGKWIVLFSLAVLAGGGAALYSVLSPGNAQTDQVLDATAIGGELDSGITITPLYDAATAVLPDTLNEVFTILDNLNPEDIKKTLGDYDAPMIQALAHNALAQLALDDALLEPKKAQRHKAQARTHAEKAQRLVTKLQSALSNKDEQAFAAVVLADAQRILGTPAREVQRNLDKANTFAAGLWEAQERRRVLVLLHVRDEHFHDALTALNKLRSEATTPRLHHLSAMVAIAQKRWPDAQAAAEALRASAPDHPSLAKIAAVLEQEAKPSTEEPPPRNDAPKTAPAPNYEQLVARGDRASQGGNCKEAVTWYEKAFDQNPSGVAALTGLGYCLIESKEFESAHRKFRAALAISSRYQDALWGVALAYEREGQTDEAIEAYQTFIEMHPNSQRSTMANRQIQRLGGTPTDQPQEQETPTETPAPESEPPPDEAPDEPVPNDTLPDNPEVDTP